MHNRSKVNLKLVSLILLVTLSPLGIDLHLPALIILKNYFSIDDHDAQLSILVFIFSMGVGQLLFGIIVTKAGKKVTGYIGILLFIVSALGILYVENYTILLIFRVLQGLGASAASVISYATINENYKGDEAAKLFSIQSGCLNIIPAVAPMMGAVLLVLWDWQAIFVCFIVYAFIVLIIFHKEYKFDDYDCQYKLSHAVSWVIKDKQFLIYALVCVLLLGYIVTYLNIAPIILMDEFGLTPLQFSILFSINAAVISAVSFFISRLIAVLGAFRCVIIGLLLMMLSSLCLWFTYAITGYLLFYLLILVGSIGFAFSFGSAIGFALSKHQHHSGLASGLLGFVYLSLAPVITFFSLHNANHSLESFGRAFAIMTLCMLGILLINFYKSQRNKKVNT